METTEEYINKCLRIADEAEKKRNDKVRLYWSGKAQGAAEVLRLGWIPVEEQLPDNGQEVLVTIGYPTSMNGYTRTTSGYHINGTWFIGQREKVDDGIKEVIAWKLLPEPLKENGK